MLLGSNPPLFLWALRGSESRRQTPNRHIANDALPIRVMRANDPAVRMATC
jgi:hypothetical protein